MGCTSGVWTKYGLTQRSVGTICGGTTSPKACSSCGSYAHGGSDFVRARAPRPRRDHVEDCVGEWAQEQRVCIVIGWDWSGRRCGACVPRGVPQLNAYNLWSIIFIWRKVNNFVRGAEVGWLR